MFNIANKVFKFAWSVFSQSNDKFNESEIDTEEDDTENNSEQYEEKNIKGTVTEVKKLDRFGLIDGTIYFHFDKVSGSKHPNVGSKVSATIFRARSEHNWTAKSVMLIDEIWDDDDKTDPINQKPTECDTYPNLQNTENLKSKAIISTVKTVANDGLVTTFDGVEFNYKTMRSDFIPYPKDVLCLNISVDQDDENKIHIIEFKSTRSSTIDGQITFCKANSGVINEEVWFSMEVCDKNYLPRRGDKVVAQAVESSLGKYMWRATLVTHMQPRNLYTKSLPRNISKPTLPVQKSFIQELLKNKNDITVTDDLTFKEVELFHKTYLTVWICNNGESNHKLLGCRFKVTHENSCQFSATTPVLYSEDEVVDSKESVLIIPPGEKAYINILCNSTYIGKSKNLLFIEFENFAIGRYIDVEVVTNLQSSLLPKSKYQKTTKSKDTFRQQEFFDICSNSLVISGVMPFKPPSNVPVKLSVYPVPKQLWQALIQDDVEAMFSIIPTVAEELSIENYSDRFSALLHLEEIQMTLDMRRYDLRDVCLTTCGEFLKLNVPGLAEGRPSLLIGDQVLLTHPVESGGGPINKGFIHEVLRNDILIKFNSILHNSYNGESFNVAFQFSRSSLRRCHQAVNLINRIHREVLFPIKSMPKPPVMFLKMADVKSENVLLSKLLKTEILNENRNKSAKTLNWFNPDLNERQKTAVQRILENQCRPLPYIIFGPPGTGKTVTLVEGILQTFHLVKNSRILIVAPSNSAADLIAARLHDSEKITDSDLARLNSFSRSKSVECIPERILKYCQSCDYESLNHIAYYRIIVSTCSTIGCLYTLGLNVKHFTHAFIDEGGQATEPECMVAIGLVAAGEGQIVLAGDHMQLGPILQSVYAKAYGLELSLLERIMKRFLYQRDEEKFSDHGNFDPFLVTKLVKNYRSHPSILNIYSTLFYNNELNALADSDIVNIFQNWPTLPKSNFPIVFSGVRGENFREDNSPSWFNPVEVVQVARFLKSLYDYGISPEDIGIITPYRKQGEKIRCFMDSLELEPCKVGSVEEFQGQEFLVIIVSTVRTCPDLCQYDVKHNLGFLSNQKRFNVAISRAMALLIVIGDPYLLSKDEHWGFLVKYCIANGGYEGTGYSDS